MPLVRRRSARVRWALLAVIAAATVACGELASAPQRPATAPLALALAWPETGGADAVFGAAIDSVRIVVARQNESTAADTTLFFPARSEEFRAAVDVPLEQKVETLYVYVDMRAGQTTLFYASDQVILREGIVPALPRLELFYIGPGVDAAFVNITPRTAFVVPGGTLQFTATAQNGQGLPVTPPFGWSVSDTRLATISATGLLQARAAGTVRVRAMTPTGVGDSLNVLIATQAP